MNTYIVFDLETSDINSRTAEIIEISAIKVENNEITSKFSSLVKPLKPINPKSTDVNGITDDMVSNAPELGSVLPMFINFIGDNVLIGYNISSFDLPILRRLASKVLGIEPNNEYLDVLHMVQRKLPLLPNKKLTTVATYFGIDTNDAHRALADCYMTNECYQRLLALKDDIENYQKVKKVSRKPSRNIKISEITSNTTTFDTSHPLYRKKCVFTGELLSLSRIDAMQAVVDVGGILKSSVSKDTDYLIIGAQDLTATKGTGVSKKERDAYTNQSKGYPIRLLNEQDFLNLLSFKNSRVKVMSGDNSYFAFKDKDDRDTFLKKYKLLSENPRKEKIFFYKGRDVPNPVICEILGYASIIDFN